MDKLIDPSKVFGIIGDITKAMDMGGENRSSAAAILRTVSSRVNRIADELEKGDAPRTPEEKYIRDRNGVALGDYDKRRELLAQYLSRIAVNSTVHKDTMRLAMTLTRSKTPYKTVCEVLDACHDAKCDLELLKNVDKVLDQHCIDSTWKPLIADLIAVGSCKFINALEMYVLAQVDLADEIRPKVGKV